MNIPQLSPLQLLIMGVVKRRANFGEGTTGHIETVRSRNIACILLFDDENS